jgi:hypothetical protein
MIGLLNIAMVRVLRIGTVKFIGSSQRQGATGNEGIVTEGFQVMAELLAGTDKGAEEAIVTSKGSRGVFHIPVIWLSDKPIKVGNDAIGHPDNFPLGCTSIHFNLKPF